MLQLDFFSNECQPIILPLPDVLNLFYDNHEYVTIEHSYNQCKAKFELTDRDVDLLDFIDDNQFNVCLVEYILA